RADVEFIEKVCMQGEARPVLILPGKMAIHDLRGSVHVLGLRARGGIRAFLVVVQPVQVKAAWLYIINNGLMVATWAVFERHQARRPGSSRSRSRAADRCPAQERHSAAWEGGRSDRAICTHNQLLCAWVASQERVRAPTAPCGKRTVLAGW